MSDVAVTAKKWMTDAILLAALTGWGYAVAYAFEMGYADHFGYPHYVISPTPATIAYALIILLLVGSVAFQAIGVAASQADPRLRAALLFSLLLGSMAFVLVVVSPWPAVSVATVAIGLAVLSWVWWRYFSVTRRRKTHVKNPGRANVSAVSDGKNERQTRAPSSDQIPHTEQNRTHLALLGFAALLTTFWIGQLGGQYVARLQNRFYMMQSRPDFAVVRMYGELVVAAKINKSTGLFTGDYLIAKVGDAEIKLDLTAFPSQAIRPLRHRDQE